MNIKRMSIKSKIQLIVGVPCFVMLIAGGIIYSNLQSMVVSSQWVTHTTKVINKADGIVAAAVDMETGMRGFLLAGKEQFLEPYLDGEQRVYKLITELQQTVSDNPPQVSRLSEVQQILTQWQSQVTEPMIETRRLVGTDKSMDDIAALVAQAKGKQYFDKFRKIMIEFIAIEARLMKEREEKNSAIIGFTKLLIIISVSIALAVGILLGVFFTRDLMRTLGGEPSEVNKITSQIASGNLAVSFSKGAPTDSLYGLMKQMVEQLRAMISDINRSTDELSSAAQQTNSIAQQTSDSISVQLDETTQVATAINEMSTTVRDVANSVSNAANASKDANSQTIDSQKEMTQTVAKMNELHAGIETASNVILKLEKSTSEINSIVEVIKGVAEQTNLLALNAAIEAARAGEQGRGFAVVADEVRSLAERTQRSTQEINTMIDELKSDVEEAVTVMALSRKGAEEVTAQVNNTNSVLNAIQIAIGNINDINTQISSAAEEQSVVVEEINENIYRVNDIAEKTSTGAKQTSVTGSAMLKQTEALREMVKRFQL